MELMAVPKKKISKHKRGIRNGPKAFKPTPVIIRCRYLQIIFCYVLMVLNFVSLVKFCIRSALRVKQVFPIQCSVSFYHYR
uniref:Large ribosomal subunit protein bL32m n=1 Tax=Arabidopsis thaliana TaxID=3702 RepID=Q5Q0D7_ARATH|nr:hypothetical protein AT1G69485 [Arabidopsis thaliana]